MLYFKDLEKIKEHGNKKKSHHKYVNLIENL
jgi:hypothetical protein